MAMTQNISPLVSTQWLAERIGQTDVVVLDASMDKVIGKEPLVYDSLQVIPGARKLDLEKVFVDHDSDQVHTLPTPEQFVAAAKSLGLEPDARIVIYDNQGVYSAPRAWWLFKTMGFDHVFVLDGGLPKWLAEQRESHTAYADNIAERDVLASDCCGQTLCDAEQVLQNIARQEFTVLDARGAPRFLGEAAEPRPGVRSGHIPGSLNLPFAQVLDDLCYKPADELQTIFQKLLADKSSAMMFSCGSGVTACIILLAAVIAGYQNVRLYDGSWSEWGSNPDLPIE
jgi:thiosulfate/3-mercaptopyruvate sulfurtransferase